MKPQVKILTQGPLLESKASPHPTSPNPYYQPVSNQLDCSPSILPMTTFVLEMACDEAPATSNCKRKTHKRLQNNKPIQTVAFPPYIVTFLWLLFFNPLLPSRTTAPPPTLLMLRMDVNSLYMAIVLHS